MRPGRMPKAETDPRLTRTHLYPSQSDGKRKNRELRKMETEFEAALSLERFATCRESAKNDSERALELHILNTQVSESHYTPLQMLEIALRNRIHAALSEAIHERWFEESGFLAIRNQRNQLARAENFLAKNEKAPTPGSIVAALSFSFWTSMLVAEYE